jgi:hypothetical protein
VPVALGNDVAKARSFGDLPLVAYLLAREHGDPIGPADLLRMLTVSGARAVGRPAELGVLALQGAAFQELIDHTARLTAEGLNAEFCKVLEYQPRENRLLVRAGIGWDADVVGTATVAETAVATVVPRVSVAPSTLDLLGVELEDAAARPVLEQQLESPALRVRAARALRRLDPALDPKPVLARLVEVLKIGRDIDQVQAAEAILLLAGPASWSAYD